MGRLKVFPSFDRKIRSCSLTVDTMLPVVIRYQFSLLKGISVEKQLNVKRDIQMLKN